MSDDIQVKQKLHDEGLNKDAIHYSRNNLLSYNGFLNFILSGRGLGKTFDFKRWALSSSKQTVWVRRYDNDLPDVESKFMRDLVKEGYFTEDSITIKDHTLIMNGEVKVYFVALSISNKKKSVPYPDVDKIIFDEFIETGARKNYLKNECEMFLDLVETVNRLRIGEPEVRCFFLGNKVSFINPYFTYFDIHPFTQNFKTFKDGLIVVENYSNAEFADLKKKSRFGQLIDGTKYGRFAIDNENWKDNDSFITTRPAKSELKVNIRIGATIMGIWYDFDNDALYVCKAHSETVYTYASRDELIEGEMALKSNQPPIMWLEKYNECGKLYFEDNIIKAYCYELIQGSYS